MGLCKYKNFNWAFTRESLVALLLSSAAAVAEPAEKLWLSDDDAVVIATGSCGQGMDALCGIIVGVPGARTDPQIANARAELCGLPIIWDMIPTGDPGEYSSGRLLDPESGKDYAATFQDQGGSATVSVGFASLRWSQVNRIEEECAG